MSNNRNHEFDVLIVGGGQAGAQVAISLRERGFAGTIGIIGEEIELPYERPALSKSYLKDQLEISGMHIRPADFWEQEKVSLFPGYRVVAVNPGSHIATISDGTEIAYKKLVWAAGGCPRQLTCPGSHLKGIHTIRSKRDVDRLKEELVYARKACIIGGGFIGLEVAAALRELGREVVVVESQDRLLARVSGSLVSRFYESEHAAHGVDFRLRASVERFECVDGKVAAVKLDSGETITCDLAVVGIGLIPASSVLEEAGAICKNGVVVDSRCKSSVEDVYAVGDCASYAHQFADGVTLRLESVQNAIEMANVVAADVVGAKGDNNAAPWFWSDQYELRLQTVGLSVGFDMEILRGDLSKKSFSVLYLKNGRVIALDCINSPRDFLQGRSLVVSRAIVSPEVLRDPGIPLKNHLSSVA